VRDLDAVFSALGSGTFLKRNPTIVVGVHNIVTSMELAGVKRFVYLSGGTVRATARISIRSARFCYRRSYINPTADQELNERMISERHLDWIIVRPPRLTNGAPTGKYRSGDDLRSNGFIPPISRADLADFILKQVEEDTQKADMRLPRA
jgi:putative NADH-flavin reductase